MDQNDQNVLFEESFDDLDDLYQDSSVDSSGELNPFMFELKYETKRWELIDAFFNRLLSEKPSVYVTSLRRVKTQLERLKSFSLAVQKQHLSYEKMKAAYDQLKHKTLNHDLLLTSIERGYQKQIDELGNELYHKQEEINDMKTLHKNQIAQIQDKLNQQLERSKGLEMEVSFLLDKQIILQEKSQSTERQIILSQGEVQNIKILKSGGSLLLSQQRDSYFSTLELIMASKVKSQILQFVQVSDILNLSRSSKRLYLAITQLKIMVPHLVFCKTAHLESQIQLLSHQKKQLENLKNSCSHPILISQIVKCYHLFNNPTDMIQSVLHESGAFLSGQLLGIDLNVDYEDEDTSGLGTFMKQIATRATSCLQDLKQKQLNWSQFCQELQRTEKDIKQVQADKQNLQKHLRLKSQDLQEQLFNISSVAASDPGLFGSYLTSLQRCCAQLFTFATQLTIETKQIMGLVYYMAVQYWNVLEKDKITEDIFQRQKLDLESALTTKANLQYTHIILQYRERMKQLDFELLQRDIQQRDMSAHYEREQKVKRQLELDMHNQTQSIQNYSTNIKKLALTLQDQKQRNKDLTMTHNQTLMAFHTLKQQVESLLVSDNE